MRRGVGIPPLLTPRRILDGLAAGGKDGVTGVLEILRSELQRTLVLMGCHDVRDLDASWLIPVDPLVGTT